MSDERRRRARELAEGAIEGGRPLAWFDELYREAARGDAIVPWDDARPNAMMTAWLDAHPPHAGARALDVGCGTGDNAAELARRGCAVTAFDVAPAAIDAARARHGSIADWQVASAIDPPDAWRGGFELVVEIYTLQCLPPPLRVRAAAALASLVAPGGTMLLIARAREPDDPEGAIPWPLTRDELEAIPLPLAMLRDRFDDERPPVRRWIATYARPA